MPLPPKLPSGYRPLPADLIPNLLSLLARTSVDLVGYYHDAESVAVDRKADRSPVTTADRSAHATLAHGLAMLTPDVPFLSEESTTEEIRERHDWRICWMVDPLDGTREFLGRTGEFTVNVALIVDQVPILGFIAQPLEHQCYLGMPGSGLWCCTGDDFEQLTALSPSVTPGKGIRMSASQRHSPQRVAALTELLEGSGLPVERINAGSALKFFALVDGRADIYPRSSPCYEWDVAAGDALVRAAGGQVLTEEGLPMAYNKRDTLLVHYFVAAAPSGLPWLPLLEGAHNLFKESRDAHASNAVGDLGNG
ncbi:MAG: 3'(2'),5'-bisphosphate nucleotidase CysQ [Luminiphilus sp.]|nr:3'(2'),5'-bisphosphate nucleotidase CysQ [Luminiphilus sp.]